MSSFMRVAGHRLTSLVRTSTRSACGSIPVSLQVSTRLNDVGSKPSELGYEPHSRKQFALRDVRSFGFRTRRM